MPETTLSSDPFLRRTALTAGAIALAILAIGVAAFLLLRPDPIPDYDVGARLVEPTDETRLTIDQITCPGDRGSSPLSGSAFRDQVESPNGKAFGSGQAVSYVLKIEAGAEAGDSGAWDLEWSKGLSNTTGVACAFVVGDDVDTVETSDGLAATANWTPAAVPDGVAGRLTVPGLEAGEQVVVQLLVALADTSNEFARLQFSMEPVGTTTSNAISLSDRADFSLPTDLDQEPTLSLADEDGVDPGDSYELVYTIENPTPAVVSNVSLSVPFPDRVTIRDDFTIADDTARATSCTIDDRVLQCSIGFMNPGESIAITTSHRTRSSAVAFWSLANGPCEVDGQQDICNQATLRWRSSFSEAEQLVSEATNLADGEDLSVRIESTTDVVYARRTVTAAIIIASDIEDGVDIDEVNVTGCIEAVYVDGDIDLDGLADPGELWQYTCAARYDETGLTEAEVIGTTAGRPVRGAASLRFSVIDPLIEIERVEIEGGGDVTLRITNVGDDPISRIAVTANQCNPRLIANADGDEVLEPEEVWDYTCPLGATGGDVFGRDSLGAPLSAAVDDT